MGSISEDNLMIICTGSRESNAALSRLVDNKNRFIEIFNDDLVIFSSEKYRVMKKNK